MVDTRGQAYAERLPRADALLASNATTGMLAERAAIETRLTAIETGADVAALGSSKEQAQWAKIRQLEAAATDSGNPDHAQLAGERDKIKLMKGVLFWQLDAQFKERSYTERRELRALDAQLNEAQNRWVRVQKARGSVPTNTEEFATRITELAARIDELKGKLDAIGAAAAAVPRAPRQPRAARAEGPPRGVRGAGALRARRHLRPCQRAAGRAAGRAGARTTRRPEPRGT